MLFSLICGLIYWHAGLRPALVAIALYYGAWELTCYRIHQITTGESGASRYDHPSITNTDKEEDDKAGPQ